MQRVLFVSILLLTLFSCKEKKQITMIPLKFTGHTYQYIERGKGQAPISGEYAIFSMKIVGDNGKVIIDLTEKESWSKYRVPRGPEEFRADNPLDELLTYLVPGDSVILEHKLDSANLQIPAFAGLKSVFYNIGMKEIISPEEMARRDSEQAKATEGLKNALKPKLEAVTKRTAEALAAYKNSSLAGLKRTKSGLEYVFEKTGSGKKPTPGERVNVHYYGIIAADGKAFDNSYDRGKPLSFFAGQKQVLAGWDEAILMMPKGSEGIFFIPYYLAYGEGGKYPVIPKRAMLVFFIEYPE